MEPRVGRFGELRLISTTAAVDLRDGSEAASEALPHVHRSA